jgi:hypothetical protein
MEAEFAPLVTARKAELEVLTDVRQGLSVVEEFYKRMNSGKGVSVSPKLGIFPWYG